jgi:hypothetical protein
MTARRFPQNVQEFVQRGRSTRGATGIPFLPARPPSLPRQALFPVGTWSPLSTARTKLAGSFNILLVFQRGDITDILSKFLGFEHATHDLAGSGLGQRRHNIDFLRYGNFAQFLQNVIFQ